MRDFIKTLANGILVVFTSILAIALIIFACFELFVELPDASGFKAVGMFILALIYIFIGGGMLYGLGCLSKNQES